MTLTRVCAHGRSTLVAVALLLGALVGGAAPARAQPNCAGWLPGAGIPGVSFDDGQDQGEVFAVTEWDPDGSGPKPAWTVVGGKFTRAGSTEVSNVAAWDGSQWRALGAGIGSAKANSAVRALAVFGGSLVAAGEFEFSGGVAAISVATWDGAAWQPMGSGLTPSAAALQEFAGDLYAGGPFGVAKWNGAAWEPIGPLGVGVRALTLFNGRLIAGGLFSSFPPFQFSPRVEAWDGTTWQHLGNLGPGSLGVDALAVNAGELIAGGAFPNKVLRWDGSAWQSLAIWPSGGSEDRVLALASYNSELFAGGEFYSVQFEDHPVLRFTGSSWTPVVYGGFRVHCLHVQGGELLAGGLIPAGVSRWNGVAWGRFSDGLGGAASAMTTHGEGLVVGGGFKTAGGAWVNGVARWDGSAWSGLGSGVGGSFSGGLPGFLDEDTVVHALAVDGGDILVGGDFVTAGGQSVNGVARWDGGAWHGLASGMNGRVLALAWFNGDLIAGGGFSTAGGVSANCIARWDGVAWHPMASGFDSEVAALVVWNGQLFAGGYFTMAGGAVVNGVARWDGAAWHPLGSGVSGFVSGGVSAFFVGSNGLYVGGGFSFAGSEEAHSIARWDGETWHALGAGTNGWVGSLTTWSGHLIAGGFFEMAGGESVSNVARWDGAAWHPLTIGADGWVGALRVHNGDLFAAGGFWAAGGQTSAYLARWQNTAGDANGDDIVNFTDLNLVLSAYGQRGEPGSVAGDVNNDGVANFIDLNLVLSFFGTTC